VCNSTRSTIATSGSAENLGGPAQTLDIHSPWRGSLAIEIQRRAGRSVVAHVEHRGPLRVQRAFQPEPGGPCHVYLLHPPGGLASQDELRIDAAVSPCAAGLFTAPSAQKVYRSSGRTSVQRIRLSAADESRLEWLPPETIVFDGARTELSLEVELAPTARFLGAEVLCLGRPASGERFARGHLVQRISIVRDGRPLFLDRLVLDAGSALATAPFGAAGHTALGTLVCTEPTETSAERLVATLREHVVCHPGEQLGITALRGVILCRFMGETAERAHAVLRAAWAVLRPPVLGSPPVFPRIWAL
jgi:urease accessory protein